MRSWKAETKNIHITIFTANKKNQCLCYLVAFLYKNSRCNFHNTFFVYIEILLLFIVFHSVAVLLVRRIKCQGRNLSESNNRSLSLLCDDAYFFYITEQNACVIEWELVMKGFFVSQEKCVSAMHSFQMYSSNYISLIKLFCFEKYVFLFLLISDWLSNTVFNFFNIQTFQL